MLVSPRIEGKTRNVVIGNHQRGLPQMQHLSATKTMKQVGKIYVYLESKFMLTIVCMCSLLLSKIVDRIASALCTSSFRGSSSIRKL